MKFSIYIYACDLKKVYSLIGIAAPNVSCIGFDNLADPKIDTIDHIYKCSINLLKFILLDKEVYCIYTDILTKSKAEIYNLIQS